MGWDGLGWKVLCRQGGSGEIGGNGRGDEGRLGLNRYRYGYGFLKGV